MIRQILPSRSRNLNRTSPAWDAFISHRGVDTKRTVAGLIYDRLIQLKLRPFMDNECMRPGDKIFEKIDSAIRGCKVGVAIFSPRYCGSYFCLHELALIMESNKRVIPIFCDIKPSELRVLDDGSRSRKELQRYRRALQEARYTVGLTFDSHNGNWKDLVTSASDIIMKRLMEVECEEEDRCQTLPTAAFSNYVLL